MGDPLGGEKGQGKDGKCDLQVLSAPLTGWERFLPPLRGGVPAKFANSPDHKQIDQRPKKRQQHHGNANCILMKAACGRVNSRRRGERREADGHADAANGDDGGAGTLQYGKEDARPTENFETCR
jgi:hypothetical protein